MNDAEYAGYTWRRGWRQGIVLLVIGLLAGLENVRW